MPFASFCREGESIRPPKPTPESPLCYWPYALGLQRKILNSSCDSSETSVGPALTFPGSNMARNLGRWHLLPSSERELAGKPTFTLRCARFLERSVQCFCSSPQVSQSADSSRKANVPKAASHVKSCCEGELPRTTQGNYQLTTTWCLSSKAPGHTDRVLPDRTPQP